MPDEAIQMPQIGDALVQQSAREPSSYLGRVLSNAWARVTLAGLRSHHGQQPDGLEALDVLGGWKGPDVARRNIK